MTREASKIGITRNRLRNSALPFLSGILAALLFLACWASDPFGLANAMRERVFDGLYLLFPRQQTEDRVQVVDIDRKTLRQLGAWPLPREKLGALIENLSEAGASVAALDIFFADADQHSSRRLADMVGSLEGGAEIAASIRNLPDSDLAFAQILEKVPSVVGMLAAPSNRRENFNPIVFKSPFVPDALRRVVGFAPPYAPIAEAALGEGISSLFGEDQGLIRRVPLILWDGKDAAAGLAMETVRIATATSVLEISPGTRSVELPNGFMPMTEMGSMRIHWSDPAHWKKRTHSAIDILANKLEPHSLAGAIVLIGSSAPETGSLRPTPVSPLTPSVQIQAEAVEQLLKAQAPWRPFNAGIGEALVGIVLATAAVVGALLAGPALAIATLSALLALWLGVTLAAFSHGLLIDPLAPSIAAIIGANVAAGLAFARTRRLKALIAQRFAQYLSPEIVTQIVAEPEQLKRAGEARVITALFTDIEGFTSMTKRTPPEQLIALLDTYFDGLCRIALSYKGMINGFAGDAIQVFFNVPLEQDNHPDAAISCALDIRRFSERFRSTPEALAAGFGRTRIGIETGEAIVGDVGGSRRLNYTAYGDAINLTARLEAANKQFGSDICIGPGAAAAIRTIPLIKRAVVAIRGFDEPIAIFTPADAPVTGPIAALPEYAHGSKDEAMSDDSSSSCPRGSDPSPGPKPR
jgi:adenylate cyclase